jgi:hypothetical protein
MRCERRHRAPKSIGGPISPHLTTVYISEHTSPASRILTALVVDPLHWKNSHSRCYKPIIQTYHHPCSQCLSSYAADPQSVHTFATVIVPNLPFRGLKAVYMWMISYSGLVTYMVQGGRQMPSPLFAERRHRSARGHYYVPQVTDIPGPEASEVRGSRR